MDFIATNNTTKPLQLHLNQKIAVYINGEYTPYNISKMMHQICFENKATQRLCKKYHWNKKTYNDIAWREHKKSLETPKYYTRKQYLKLIHN